MSLELKKRILTSLGLFILLVSMYMYTFVLISSLIIITVITWIEFYALISKILIEENFKNKFYRFLCKSISLLYLLLLVFFLFSIEYQYVDLKPYLIYSVFVSILTDIGGLVFGKIIKGKKLTKISPNKTIAGLIGSFVFSLLMVPFFYSELMEGNLILLSIITILISAISQLGDLFISYLKRQANVKHTSNILPGHGGFLDRIDGMIFAIPLGILLFNFF